MSISKLGRVEGRTKILRNLRKEIDSIEGDISVGLKLSGAHLLGETKEITPVAEIDGGTLINSGFSDLVRFGRKSTMRVGFTANYAPLVHEMPASTNFHKTGATRKFLERTLVKNVKVILSIIKRKAKR